ncbi:MAG: uroporphyrinogen-III C-methyltransferase [Bradyrhizobium sp.]|uniref:uroporphyrinogen-III C-methyltransferase n=1 Tax=Bradyrhizobium sp. TaxID=376 RepID=UPI0025BC5004|nr:uroporphyrinogen-III C-methyltransferase [Bradyrhizobium sp.]MBI5263333.1 uroporphyrinogen-III C-methyltransferase [Bradyrhizobium sp.]
MKHLSLLTARKQEELPASTGVLAARRAAEALLELERECGETVEPSVGEVYLVGAGPGDPDLLTIRALRLMQKADVVVYDRLVDPAILDLIRGDAERIYVGKRRSDHALPQEEISKLLARLASEGKRVLRLKGGDPFIFGRGGEEIETLAERGIPFQVCPGITAAAGCSAYSGIPLTHRDHAHACIFVTAQGKNGAVDLDWNVLLQPRQTVAIYMGLTHLGELMREFIARGADPESPAAVVDNGTRRGQRVVTGTLTTLAAKAREAGLRGPTVIIVGSVVSLRDKLNWFSPELPDTADDLDAGVRGTAAMPDIEKERVRAALQSPVPRRRARSRRGECFLA